MNLPTGTAPRKRLVGEDKEECIVPIAIKACQSRHAFIVCSCVELVRFYHSTYSVYVRNFRLYRLGESSIHRLPKSIALCQFFAIISCKSA